jgi:hypothetical protein
MELLLRGRRSVYGICVLAAKDEVGGAGRGAKKKLVFDFADADADADADIDDDAVCSTAHPLILAAATEGPRRPKYWSSDWIWRS